MADTTSPLLGLLLQATGGNNNSWGDNLNNSVILLIEQAVAGRTDVTGMTGGDVTLTPDQVRSRVVTIQGTLTSDLVLTIPGTTRLTTFISVCGGGFAVRVTSTSGNSVNLPTSKWVDIHVTAGIVTRTDSNSIGELFYHAGTTVPNGAFECNGAALKRASYPDLFGRIGTTYGTTDSTDFKLPLTTDTGRFLRSRSASLAVGTSQANQNKAHTHTGSGTTTGESVGHTHTGSGTTSAISNDHTHTQQGTFTSSNDSPDHTHTVGASQSPAGGFAPGSGPIPGFSGVAQNSGGASTRHTHTTTISGQTGGVSANHTHTYSFTTSDVSADHTHTYSFTTSGGSADGTEARPESLVGLLCIRY